MGNGRRFATVLIILFFIFSVLVSAAHLFIYYLPNKDQLFSTMLSRVLQKPVQIRQVTVQGFVLNPTVMLDDVVIGNPVIMREPVRISHLSASMNIWKSLLETRWKTQIVSANMQLKPGRLHIEMQIADLFSSSPHVGNIYIDGEQLALAQSIPFLMTYFPELKPYHDTLGEVDLRAWLNEDAQGWQRLQAKVAFHNIHNKLISIPAGSTHFVVQREKNAWELFGTVDQLHLIDPMMLHEIQGITGEFRFTPTRGALQLNGKNAQIVFASHPLRINLFSQLNWQQEKTGWHIQVDALKWDEGQNHFFSQFSAQLYTEKNPALHIVGNAAFNDIQLSDLHLRIAQKDKVGLIIKAVSAVSVDFLKAHIQSPWLNQVNGKTMLTAEMSIPNILSPAVDTLKIFTNLKGVSISQLPEPFRKSADTAWPIESTLQFLPGGKIKSFGSVGSLLSAAFIIDEKKSQVLSGNIHFGGQPAKFQTSPGVLIDGYLSRFNLSEWEKLSQSSMPQYQATRLPDGIRKIDLTLGLCDAFDQSFHRLWIRIVPIDSGTQITLHNAQMIGDIYFPSVKNIPLRMNFKKLSLKTKTDIAAQPKTINPMTIPPLNITINELKINDRSDGKVSLITHSIADGLSISEMKINSPLLKMSVRGRWVSRGSDAETALTGTIQSNDLGQVLSQRRLSSRLKGGDFSSEFALRWPGGPQQFSIHRASGRVEFYMQNGRIMQLDSNTQGNIAIAHLLNLVSLESLSHLLKFNFSNPLKKGFPFEDFRGKCDVDHGALFARSMNIESSLAKINITGKIGLENQTNDLTMRVIPSGLSSSLPTIAGLAGGPMVGAATWVANKLFSSQVDSLMEREYRITGTWDHPKVV